MGFVEAWFIWTEFNRNDRIKMKRNFIHCDLSPVMHVLLKILGLMLEWIYVHSSFWFKYIQMHLVSSSLNQEKEIRSFPPQGSI